MNTLTKYENQIFRTGERFISSYEFEQRVNIFITYFGSGKTQLAINEFLRTNRNLFL